MKYDYSHLAGVASLQIVLTLSTVSGGKWVCPGIFSWSLLCLHEDYHEVDYHDISHDYLCVLYTSLVEVRVENAVTEILCELRRMSRERLLLFSKHDL